MIKYLSGREVAAHVGIKPSTWRDYLADGRTPPPDAKIGDTPGWLPETLDRWQAARPGHGGRPRRQDAHSDGRAL